MDYFHHCHKQSLAEHNYLSYAEIKHYDWMIQVMGSVYFIKSFNNQSLASMYA